MKTVVRWSCTVAFMLASMIQHATSGQFPDARDPVPSWYGPVFRLSQDYPTAEPRPEEFPWKRYDPKTQPHDYIQSVFRYVLEGNVDVDWQGDSNRVRKWFHAPWLHWGRNGREFIHGLTHERVSQPRELAYSQTSLFQNWAVGMYNPPGGYTIGQVWRDSNGPDPKRARFPEGTVGVKLLYTQATSDQVPYLSGAKEWQAYIYTTITFPTNPNAPRSVQTLRLLQIDLAIKDQRVADTTGWVFGTFVFNGLLSGRDAWDKFVPVGVVWGNDPSLTLSSARSGQRIKEGWINFSRDVPYQHLGYAGRLNGPVDNPASSCLSCHGAAQWEAKNSLIPPDATVFDSPYWMEWFRNFSWPEAFSTGAVSLDYSLQLMSGIANFYDWKYLTQAGSGTYHDVPPNGKLGEGVKRPPITRSGNFD